MKQELDSENPPAKAGRSLEASAFHAEEVHITAQVKDLKIEFLHDQTLKMIGGIALLGVVFKLAEMFLK